MEVEALAVHGERKAQAKARRDHPTERLVSFADTKRALVRNLHVLAAAETDPDRQMALYLEAARLSPPSPRPDNSSAILLPPQPNVPEVVTSDDLDALSDLL
jgi:hypothetical protein